MMDALSPPPTIVLVDDDAALLRALKFSLELEGFVVQAHRTTRSVRPADLPVTNACLVLDYLLPERNGIALLEQLRAEQVNLPTIVITSHPRAALRQEAARLGASVVEKPLIGPALSREIRSQIARAR